MVRSYLVEHVVGRTIQSITVLDDGILEKVASERLKEALEGRKIVRMARHGKQLFLQTEGGMTMTIHLGMTGDLNFLEIEEKESRFARLLIEFEDGSRLEYEDMRKFGAVGMTLSKETFVALKRLAPDALSIGRKEFSSRVLKHHKAIKSVLLDQRIVAGIGNLYADEILFQSRVHPAFSAASMTEKELARVYREMRKVLRQSIQIKTDFSRLPPSYLLRDRSIEARCPRGHKAMQTMMVGGRTAYFCAVCQKIEH